VKIRDVLRTYLVLLAGRIASKALVLLSAAITARALGPSETGLLGTCLTILALVWILSNIGTDAIAIRRIEGEADRVPSAARQVVGTRALVGIVAALLSFGVAWIARWDAQVLIPLGIAALAYAFRFDWALLSVGKDSAVALASTAREIAYLVLVALVVVSAPTVVTALWCYAIAEVLWSSVTVVVARGVLRSDRRIAQAPQAMRLASEGWPIAFMGLMVLIYNKIDTPLLAWLRGTNEAGMYWAAYSAVFGATSFAAELSRAAFVHMARSKGRDAGQLSEQVMKLSMVLGAVGIGVALVLQVGAGVLMRAAYGPAFANGAVALKILAWCIWANYSYAVLQQSAIFSGRQVELAWVSAGAAVTNIALNVWMIPAHGMVGASLASVTAESMVLIGAIWCNRGVKGIRPLINFQACALAAGLAFTAVVATIWGDRGAWPAVAITAGGYSLIACILFRLFVRSGIVGTPASPPTLAVEGTPGDAAVRCRVALFQRSIPWYRSEILDRLASYPGIDLTVYSARFDRELRVAKTVTVTERQIGRIRFHPDVLSARYRSSHDVLVCEGGLSLMSSVLSALHWRHSALPIVWWTSLWRPDGTIRVGRDLRGLLTRTILRRCAAVVTYSRTAAMVAEDSGVSRERIFVAPNSLDTETLLRAESEWRAEPDRLRAFCVSLGIQSAKTILFVGRLTRGKRLDLLARAFAETVALCPAMELRLVVVGDGPERDRFTREVAAAGIGRLVVMCGAITEPADVCPFFLSATAVVMPGTGGLVINQALTHGVPVIVGGGDGTERDLVSDGENGYLLVDGNSKALASRMRQLVQAPRVEWEAMSARARETIVGKADSAAMIRGLVAAIRTAHSGQVCKSHDGLPYEAAVPRQDG